MEQPSDSYLSHGSSLEPLFSFHVTVETGQFEIIKGSVGRLTPDPRLQALLIAFAFGGFLEGAAGFGTPVAIASTMLVGLGFTPFSAAAICPACEHGSGCLRLNRNSDRYTRRNDRPTARQDKHGRRPNLHPNGFHHSRLPYCRHGWTRFALRHCGSDAPRRRHLRHRPTPRFQLSRPPTHRHPRVDLQYGRAHLLDATTQPASRKRRRETSCCDRLMPGLAFHAIAQVEANAEIQMSKLCQ